jgi:hypothetical protein
LKALNARRALRFLCLAFAASLVLAPNAVLACACGCSVFDVGAGTMMPVNSDSGFSLWFRYSYMDQNQNWEGSSKAPASDNSDIRIRTSFYTVGGNVMIDRSWSLMVELPVYSRRFTSTDDGTVAGPAGSLYTANLTDLGDMTLSALYTGLSEDRSTGLSVGVKLPTGNYTGPNGPLGGSEFDRDTLPGTGSTDVVLGAYHVGGINADDSLAWFAQAKYQFAALTRNDYRPGNDLNAALGLTWSFGGRGSETRITPILQLIGSWRERDSGAASDADNSGYKRLLVAPGVEARIGKVRLYADVEFPVYQFTNAAPSGSDTSGQLVASSFIKAQISYDF